MTHEFKTPITASKIAIETITKTKAFEEESQLTKYFKIIEDQLDHLNEQIERILQLSVSERKTLRMEKKFIDPILIIHKVAEVFFSHKIPPSIKIMVPEIPVKIKADEIHFTNLIYSIVDNAIKYSVNQPVITIDLSISDDQLVLSIEDQGLGIEKRYQKKVFQKFFRVPTGNLYKVKGFGIGLYYVKKIVEKHQWKLIMESKPGEGTIFKIIIPKKDSFIEN
jgi:two-component system, OmpR family, phosphate regulon sensor histidine kinase PhoR